MNAIAPDPYLEQAQLSYRLAVTPPAVVRVIDEVLDSSAIFKTGTGLVPMSHAVIHLFKGTGFIAGASLTKHFQEWIKKTDQVLTIQEMLQDLINRGLSVSNLAAIFDVSRPTVYSWSDGILPQEDKQARVDCIYKLIATLSKQEGSLLPKMWRRRMADDELSLYEILTAEEINQEEFNKAIISARPLMQKMAQRVRRQEKSTAELVNETIAVTENRLTDWDLMPGVGKELMNGEEI